MVALERIVIPGHATRLGEVLVDLVRVRVRGRVRVGVGVGVEVGVGVRVRVRVQVRTFVVM